MRQEPKTKTLRRLAAAAVLIGALAAAPGPARAQTWGPEALGFKKSFIIEIANPSSLALENHAVVIAVADIRASVAADFNTYHYAVFEEKGGEYALVVSQADDLDKDRYHDEIVLVRSLPPSSKTRLICYYRPDRSFQLMPAQKAFARTGWQAGGAEAGWESNLAAFTYTRGRIEFLGKLQAGLVLKSFPVPASRPQDWGMAVFEAGESPGLGGLSLWDGASRVPLFGDAAPRATLTVLAPGPVRALVKADYPAVRTSGGEVGLTLYLSAFAEAGFSRQDLVVASKPAGPVTAGPGFRKLDGGTWSVDKDKGFLSVWGKGTDKAGEVGLAAVFSPGDFSGIEETAVDRALKLAIRPGGRLTYWVAGAWERGVTSPGVPAGKNWPRKVQELAARLLVPVKVELRSK